jgi:hypothetical protein
MLKRTKFAISFLTALAAISIALAAHAQTPTHAQTQSQSQSKPDAHGGMSHDGASHDGMSHDGCPMMQAEKSKTADAASHAGHSAEMNARGEQAMGFSQMATTHHFLLRQDGGAIQVEANDAKDDASRAQIRSHLAHIAEMFAKGDFDTPMFVHDEIPPGVSVMQKLKAEIGYRYEETAGGARVLIKTSNAEALAAVHDFLRFQIKEHHTGDSLEATR